MRAEPGTHGSWDWFLPALGAQAGCRSSSVHAQMLLLTRTLGTLTDCSPLFVVHSLLFVCDDEKQLRGVLQRTIFKVLM